MDDDLEKVDKLVVVVEEEQEEVDNLLDLLYTGIARHTQGLDQLKAMMQVKKESGFFSRKFNICFRLRTTTNIATLRK